MTHFDTYGRMAKADVEDVIQNGRYLSQAEAEKLMPLDIVKKLDLREGDSFLDVGCGSGVNLAEALKHTKDCAACDHPDVITKISQNPDFKNVKLHGGNFLEIDFKKRYSKVLVYGVVPTLPSREVLDNLIERAVSVMSDGGMLLIGDVCNADKKKRFLNSTRGAAFQKEWEEKQKSIGTESSISNYIQPEETISVAVNDEVVFDILKKYRDKGFHAYLLSQPQNLPFGNTREDILIIGPEYKDA